MTKGVRYGGRQKGTKNKEQVDVAGKLRAMGFDPFEAMAQLASGTAPCTGCFATGKAKSLGKGGKVVSVTCPKCLGTKKENVSHELRGNMAKELAKYVAPQLKAIEYSAPPDATLRLKNNRRELARRFAFALSLGLMDDTAVPGGSG